MEFPANKKYLMANPIKPEGEILLLGGDIIPFQRSKKKPTSSISFLTALNTRIGFRAIMSTIVRTSQREPGHFMRRSEATYRY
jgi:hypothetical protein